jgi:hypothetical protein
MSRFASMPVTCPCCGKVELRAIVRGIDVGRSAEWRDQVLDDCLHRFRCEPCGATFRYESAFLYVDLERRQLIAHYPTTVEPYWKACESQVLATWKHVLVPNAPPEARALVADFRVRVAFGLDALREKLIAFDAGIDDSFLELLKLDLARRRGLAVQPGRRLRLRSATSSELLLRHDGAEQVVARSVLAALVADAGSWAPALQAVSGHYVDLGRILVAQNQVSVRGP